MTSTRGYEPGAFFMPSTKAAGDDPRSTSNKRKDKKHMDYESFKEKFVDDVKDCDGYILSGVRRYLI